MKILVTNDDGIAAEGIYRLAKLVSNLGEVFVVAPDNQCSAMSQRITLRKEMQLKKITDFPIKDVKAYSLSGTPADCVKVAVEYLLEEKPDFVFSGINKGYNAGIEVVYSGTVAAAMEGVLKGIPSIAFSVEENEIYDVVEEYGLTIIKQLLSKPIDEGKIWNVNFPGCKLSEFKGILWERTLAKTQYYLDHYLKTEEKDDCCEIMLQGYPITEAKKGSDLEALINRYISIGKIINCIWNKNN